MNLNYCDILDHTSCAVKRVLSQLRDVKRVGSGWVARCPVPTHGKGRGDRNPSLSIKEGADGRVLLRCHAGCSPEQIVAAIGLTMSDLFPQQERNAMNERKIVATYPYHDASGNLLFEVVRFEPKSFAQRRPDGKGSWIWNLDGVPRVLYRLPEVLEAIKRNDTVYIVEGEKDVESLRALGLIATTNPHGAGKWRDEYSESLRGARVVVLPDKDEVGRKHAEHVARSLYGVAASVKVLELPGNSKDVSKWLAAGYTREDLEALVEQTQEWEPPQEPIALLRDTLTDLGNAERFAKLHKDKARHVPAWGWLVWDGRRWRLDEAHTVTNLAIETVRAIYREAAECADANRRKQLADHAKRSESRQRIEAMLKLAEALLAEPPSAFDRDPYLLNVTNGTIDLRKMQFREHRREDNITKIAPVEFDPTARCPLWEAFLDRIFDGNHALISFLQRAVGYALTGDTREQCLFILWGTGANGKSTFVTTIQAILGDYALQTPTETLLAKRTEYIPNDIARLKGARFVSAIESAEGRKLNEPLIKQMTGGDKISARFLHREWFDFYPEFKIFLATNHKPVIRGTDHAIWRRIRLIPFTVTIPEDEQDKELPRKLLAEASGILNWALEGCLAWQREGLEVPDEVRQATESYRAEMDVLAAFLDDRCILDPNTRVTSKELYQAYMSWCRDCGEEPLSQRAFGRALSERGFTPAKLTGGTRGWVGIALKAPGVSGVSEDNATLADQIVKSGVIPPPSGANFRVFSGNSPYIEKNRKVAPLNATHEGDFSDQIEKSGVFDVDNQVIHDATPDDDDDEPTEEELEQIPCPF